MSGFFSGLLSLLTTGISNIFEGGSWNNLGNILGNAGRTANDIGNQNMAGNLVARVTGSRLTDAEREANQFTAQREDLAWQRQQDMFNRQVELENSAYQRQVADMKAAGINPLMAASSGGGAAVPSASVPSGASSVSPANGNLGSLLSAAIQFMTAKADINLKNAEAAKLTSETKGIDISNEVEELTKEAKVEAANLRNSATRADLKIADKKLDEIDAHIQHLKETAATEESRRQYNEAQSILAKMNAFSVMEMLPYEKAYKSAATNNQKEAALLSAAHALYQNKLIDDGYIDAIVSKEKSEAASAESKSELDAIKSAIRTGDYSKVKHNYSLTGDILSTVAILLDNFNPFNGLFK